MESPLSPILADLVMNDLEVERLSNLNLTVLFYYRYVDDILLALPEGEVDKVLEVFNANPYQIKFTMEKEIDKTIIFLTSRSREISRIGYRLIGIGIQKGCRPS